jgi:hypothetical protein
MLEEYVCQLVGEIAVLAWALVTWVVHHDHPDRRADGQRRPGIGVVLEYAQRARRQKG